MMRTLRKKTRLVLLIALAGFLLLIFFQWGMDITGIRTTPMKNIAEIDGIPISYADYYRFSQLRERENKGVSRDEIWAMLIDEIVWNNLIKREKVRVTDEEIWAIIRTNPPREIYESEFMKDENGQFDYNKYVELLRAPQSRQWLHEYEFNLRRQLPKEKLRSLISTMGWVSPYEDSFTIASQTARYGISFITIRAPQLRSLIALSEEEMEQYFDEHRDEFTVPQSKILKYVFFERKPSSYDTTEARERIEDFVWRISEGEDFLELAREASDDTIISIEVETEVDLKPYLMSVYKKLKNGEISDIIQGPDGFEVMKRVRKGLIYLMKADVDVSVTTLAEIRDQIEAFKDAAREIGFDSAAAEINAPIRMTFPLREDYVSFPVRNTAALSEFLSHAKEKEIGGPMSSLGGYYLFMLDSIIPQKEPTFEEATPRIRATLDREKIRAALELYFDDISNQLRSGVTMEDIAASDTIVIFRTDLPEANLFQLQNRYGAEFAGMTATLESGDVSPPLVTDWAGYIIRCDRKIVSPFDSSMVSLLQLKRQTRLQQITEDMFTPEKIEDNRDFFFE